MNGKRPIWPALLASLIVPPILYVTSYGPACRVLHRTDLLLPLYRPLLRIIHRTEWTWLEDGMRWYGGEGGKWLSLIVLVEDSISFNDNRWNSTEETTEESTDDSREDDPATAER